MYQIGMSYSDISKLAVVQVSLVEVIFADNLKFNLIRPILDRIPANYDSAQYGHVWVRVCLG